MKILTVVVLAVVMAMAMAMAMAIITLLGLFNTPTKKPLHASMT